MGKPTEAGRPNQRRRTRKDLLAAAARLLAKGGGRVPDMDEVAAEALVSRATAYRYFPSIEALLIEAPLDGDAPDPEGVFAGDTSTDPVQRVDKAEAMLHEMCYRNETQLRLMLISSLERAARGEQSGGRSGGGSRGGSGGVPIRQNRREGLIHAALAPARSRFSDAAYKRLCASLALLFGVESMIVFSDVLGVDKKAARKVKSWAARALVEAALEESTKRGGASPPRGPNAKR